MAVVLCHREVELEPAVQDGIRGGPCEGPVVGLAGGQHALGVEDATELDEGGDGVTEMLEHLVHVDHVERGIGEPEGEQVGHLEAQVLHPQVTGVLLGLGHHVGGRIDPDGLTRRHQECQVGRDGSGARADVEQALARAQQGKEVRARVLGRAPGVTAQYRLMVPVRITIGGRTHAQSVRARRTTPIRCVDGR